MHPEFLRELTSQRNREMRARAQESALARMLRAVRHGTKAPDEFVVPAIPDYVDGSFRTTPADDTAGEVTTAQHAA
jgi:hypothetical protein